MAKTKYRTRYVKAKRVYRRGRSGGGKYKNIIDGVLAGILGNIASKYLGSYGIPAAAVGIGVYRKNVVLQTEGARELGLLIGNQLPFIGGGQTTIGGSY